MKWIYLTLISFLLVGCNKYEENHLHGAWVVASWKKSETGQDINRKMDFSFTDDRRYTVDYGPRQEKGKYWIATDYLHTVEDGKAEKKVRIQKLTPDTLSFEMNRSGSVEDVLLVRPRN